MDRFFHWRRARFQKGDWVALSLLSDDYTCKRLKVNWLLVPLCVKKYGLVGCARNCSREPENQRVESRESVLTGRTSYPRSIAFLVS
jgi:hypothetical protein